MIVKNFSTQIKVEKTIMEIERILVKFNAQGIYKEYEGQRVSGLMFFMIKDNEKIPFKIPMSIQKSKTVIKYAVEKGKLPQRFLQEPLLSSQGQRVSWRIIKDWIHSQLSLIEINYAEPTEIFLPYIYDIKQDKTLYDKFIENKEKYISLENKDES